MGKIESVNGTCPKGYIPVRSHSRSGNHVNSYCRKNHKLFNTAYFLTSPMLYEINKKSKEEKQEKEDD